MKAKIQKIFGGPAASEGSGGAPAVKSEPIFETKHEDVYQSTSSCGPCRGGKHRGRSQVRFRTGETINKQSNLTGKDSTVLRCFNCDSTKHLSDNIANPKTSHGIWRFIPHRGDYIPQSEAEWDI